MVVNLIIHYNPSVGKKKVFSRTYLFLNVDMSLNILFIHSLYPRNERYYGALHNTSAVVNMISILALLLHTYTHTHIHVYYYNTFLKYMYYISIIMYPQPNL